MPTAYLPKRCGIRGLIQALGDANALAGDWEGLVIQVPPRGFIDVGAMAFLCSWASGMARDGRRIHLRGDERTRSYLARMDLHQHVGMQYDKGSRRDETGRFIPLRQVGDEDDVFTVVNQICDLVVHQFDDGAAFLPALEWAVNEAIDNIIIHSETPVPGSVCAQYFPKKHRLEVGICDLGRGIKASLETSRTLHSHGEAVTSALERGVTRDKAVGQGNGLAGALEISRQNGGAFNLWTGDVVYRMNAGRPQGFSIIPTVAGTGLKFSLDTRRPVDLEQTWIADNESTFLLFEAGRIEEGGGLDIAESCLHTGSRPPARRLRRKVTAILPEMDEPLVLDFSKVQSASSSFLDELLGRLAAELGPARFHERIRIHGMSPLLRKMADVVVQQRLGDTPELDLDLPQPAEAEPKA